MNINQHIGVFTARLILGFIFLMQGFGKVFTWGMESVCNMEFFLPQYKGILPDVVTIATAYYTSYVEFIGGILLIFGLKRDWALYALASVLVIVTFGHGLVEPIWNLSHVMPRAILLITLLLLPKEWDKFSLDYLLSKRKSKN